MPGNLTLPLSSSAGPGAGLWARWRGALADVPAERWLQWSMALTVALAALVLGLGEENYAICVVGLVAGFGSVVVTDVYRWVSLNNRLANFAGLLTVLICLWELRQVETERRVLALTNLLFYLHCVNLFRPKEPRIYWMLALLSLLEVAVSSALLESLFFGALMTTYFLTSVATLMLFSIERERRGVLETGHHHQTLREHLRHLWRQSQASSATAANEKPAAAVFRPLPRGKTPAHAARVVRYAVGMTLKALLLTGAVFLLIPRAEQAELSDFSDGNRSTVGFEERQMDLGELGEVSESSAEVMRVRLLHHGTQEEFVVSTPLLMRGTLMVEYLEGARHSAWRPDDVQGEIGQLPQPGRGAPHPENLVDVETTMQPTRSDALFAVLPITFRINSSDEVRYDSERERISRKFSAINRKFTYTLATPGFVQNRQCRFIPAGSSRLPLNLSQLTPKQVRALPELSRIAAEVIEAAGAKDNVAKAEALTRFLRDSGSFRYELQPLERNPESDPIEDFVSATRAGHCEYFASALTLMLRSQGIPARMALGYKGPEYHPLGGFHLYRELHAHAWVEVYVPRSELPDDSQELPSEIRKRCTYGAWLTADPTPAAAGAEEEAAAGSRFPSWNEIVAYTQQLWSQYVVGLNAQRQRETIYKPVVNRVASFFDPETWQLFFADLKAFVTGEDRQRLRAWFDWQAGLLVSVVLLALVLGTRVGRRLLRGFVRRAVATVSKAVERHDPVVEFYRKFEELAGRQQWRRGPAQTQHEFALDVGGRLADRAETQTVAGVPRQVTEAFYRVRFGGRPLDSAEAEGVEHALGLLESALTLAATGGAGSNR